MDFNATQPRRDLFFAGDIGLQFVINRYDRIQYSLSALSSVTPTPDPTVTAACGTDNAAILGQLTIVEGWPSGDDKAQFLPVVRAYASQCEAMRRGHAQISALVSQAHVARPRLAASYARDLMAIDRAIQAQDMDLRLTPAEAVSTAVVSPLRLLDTLISGQNVQGSLNRIAINESLDRLEVGLTSLPAVGSAPSVVLDDLLIPEGIDLRTSFQRNDQSAGSGPTAASVQGVAGWLRSHVGPMALARETHNNRVRWAGDLRSAMLADKVSFDYQLTTSSVSVTLSSNAEGSASSTTTAPLTASANAPVSPGTP